MAATSPEVLVDASSRDGRTIDRSQIAALTGLRGFAALVVVFVHGSGPTAYPWVGLHSYGPIALFVLSGFLLFQPWSKWMLGMASAPTLRTFLRRRTLRIFPAYLVTLLIVAMVYPPSRPTGLEGWIRSLTLTQTTHPAGLRPGMEHTWSLGTELTWYVLLPVVGIATGLLVTRGRLRPLVAMSGLIIAAALATGLWRWHVAVNITDLDGKLTRPYWLPSFLICFIGGAFVAHLVLSARVGAIRNSPVHWFAARPWLVLVAALASAGIANSSLGGGWGWSIDTPQERTIRFIFSTLFAFVLLMGVAAGRPSSVVTRIFSSRWLVAVGRWSYGVYLWHLPVREIMLGNMSVPSGPGGLLWWLTLILAISIPLGAATYTFVERPAIAWSKRGRSPATGDQKSS